MRPLKSKTRGFVGQEEIQDVLLSGNQTQVVKQQGQCVRLSVGGKENTQTCLLRHGTLLEGETRNRAGWGVTGERGIFFLNTLWHTVHSVVRVGFTD